MATITFNVSEVAPEQEFAPIPEGRYEAVVTTSDVRPTRAGNGSYILLEFEVISGEYKGRKLWNRYNVENPNQDAVRIGRAQFAAVCRAVNVPSPKDTSELHNLSLILSVKCQKQRDSDEIENVIKGYAPKTEPVFEPEPAFPPLDEQPPVQQIVQQPVQQTFQQPVQQPAQQPVVEVAQPAQAAQVAPWARRPRR